MTPTEYNAASFAVKRTDKALEQLERIERDYAKAGLSITAEQVSDLRRQLARIAKSTAAHLEDM